MPDVGVEVETLEGDHRDWDSVMKLAATGESRSLNRFVHLDTEVFQTRFVQDDQDL